MKHNQTSRYWHAAAQCLVGSIGLALLTFVCFRLHVSITTAVRGSITPRFGLESTLGSSPQMPWFCTQIDG